MKTRFVCVEIIVVMATDSSIKAFFFFFLINNIQDKNKIQLSKKYQ